MAQAFEYRNRAGDVYYLQQGTTKTGKPKYWFGRKIRGTPVETMPPGYETYEAPDKGQVYVRKIRPSRIAAFEREMVEEAIRRDAGLEWFIVEVDGDALVVWLPGTSESEVDRLIMLTSGELPRSSYVLQRQRASWLQQTRYQRMMRFRLVDPEERLYSVDRWCFRGSIDDWYPLESGRPLPDLLRKYVQHLGRESFFELMF